MIFLDNSLARLFHLMPDPIMCSFPCWPDKQVSEHVFDELGSMRVGRRQHGYTRCHQERMKGVGITSGSTYPCEPHQQ